MLDKQDLTLAEYRRLHKLKVQALAAQALSQVKAETSEKSADAVRRIVLDLTKAFLSDTPRARRDAMSILNAHSVSREDFVQNYAVKTARHIGSLWEANEISFADVTIGVARIQETVRSISARRIDWGAEQKMPRILLLAPEQEDHLLGLFIAAEAFGAIGCSVEFALGLGKGKIAENVRTGGFAMIGLSVGSQRSLTATKDVIAEIRSAANTAVPIVLGGSLAHTCPQSLTGLGANYIECDPSKALGLCNIEIPEAGRVGAAGHLGET